MQGKYVMAVNPNFVEVYNTETAGLMQILPFSEVQCLSENDDSNPDDRILISSVLEDNSLFIQEITMN